jgi:hypothetical protein
VLTCAGGMVRGNFQIGSVGVNKISALVEERIWRATF